MKTVLYLDNDTFVSGITLKDKIEPEQNNMALHVCLNPESVLNNRKKLALSLDHSIDDFVLANQTHSANFHKVSSLDKGKGARNKNTAIADVDALYTYEPNIVLGAFTADCVPVMFHNKVNGLIGVIHSGWQGTVKEITHKLFTHLTEVERCNPADFQVQIGPALSQEKFEVDEDVYKQFDDLGYAEEYMHFNETTKKYHIDNQQTVKKQCELAGVPANQITIDLKCTYIDPDGFSYREDRKFGRHLAFIVRK
ncbi:peptidoglycan editing factor PgeF [Sporosarcina sp. CAU 1771]